MSRSLRVVLIAVAALFVIVILGACAALWRLNQGPVSGAFLTSTIQKGVDSYIPDTHTELSNAILSWDNIDHSITLHAEDVEVKDDNGAVIAAVPNFNIHLSAIGLLFGQFLPLDLNVEHPQIKLTRDNDGIWRFGGHATESKSHGDAKQGLARAAHNMAHAYVTRMLQVSQLVLDVDDARTDGNWSINVPEITLETGDGDIFGHTKIDLTQKDAVSTVDVHYEYNRDRAVHILKTQLDSITPSFFAGGHPGTLGLDAAGIMDLPLSGKITAEFNDDLDLNATSFDIHGGAGTLHYTDFWDKPRDVQSVDIKADYDKLHQNLTATAGIDFGGPTLTLNATGTPPTKPKVNEIAQDLDFEMNVEMNDWPMDQFKDMWPKPVVTNAYEWIAKSLSKGKFTHGEASFKGSLAWIDLADIDMREGGGKITAKGGRVDYLEGMPPVDGVNAEGTFDLAQMTVDITSGGIGDLHLQPFTIQMTGFEDHIQYIDIPLKVAGPLVDVLKLIDAPRLNYAKAIGIQPSEVAGRASGTIEMKFPMLNEVKMKEIEVHADVNLSDVASGKLVKGVDIQQGDMNLTLDKDGFEIKGPLLANKILAKLVWTEFFEEQEGRPLRHAIVSGTIGDEQWNTIGIDALKGTRGPATINIEMVQPTKEKKSVKLQADLTSTEIHVDQMKWKKPAGSHATLKVAADMDEGRNIDIKSVELLGDQVVIKGNAVLTPEGDKPLAINLNPLKVGRTDAALHFTQSTDAKGGLKFDAEGASVDISGLKGGHDPGHTDPRPKEYRIKVGTLYTSDNGFMTDAKGYAIRDAEGWSEISLSGMAGGNHKLNVDLAPKDGRRFFAITCDDFGMALKGLGITDTVSGGTFDIHGESTLDDPRMINGDAKIGSFTVKNLPALAVLLNAASPFGIPNLLMGNMEFSSLNGKFKWKGDTIYLEGVRALSTAVALNIEGKVDMNAGDAALSGTIVPFSMISSVLGAIPILGDIMTGGDGGGVIAVVYSITGNLNNPNVSVNPASLLAPGFLRGLLFGPSENEDGTPPVVQPTDVPTATPDAQLGVNGNPMPPAQTNFNKN